MAELAYSATLSLVSNLLTLVEREVGESAGF